MRIGNKIYLYGQILQDYTDKMFLQDLAEVEGDIELHINSVGGDIFASIAIGNATKSYAGNVTCIIDGLCASSATIISSTCKNVVMANNALMMVHNPLSELYGLYNAEQLEKVKNTLNKIGESVTALYCAKTGLSSEEIAEILKNETWFNAQEAVEKHFADSIADNDAEIEVEENAMFVNKMPVDCKNFDMTQIKSKIKPAKKIESVENLALGQILSMVQDNMQSGAENIGGSFKMNKTDSETMRINSLLKMAKEGIYK